MSTGSSTYIETDDQLGAVICWKNAHVVYECVTHRGTKLEFVQRPNWGISCFMNNTIQSSEIDETIYHANLVQPCFLTDTHTNVCIFGGGEGATAREVLRHASVKHVTMFEWDVDVIKAFQQQFPQWARGAWNDPRLSINIHDAFEAVNEIPDSKFNIVIIDLFEPEEQNSETWYTFFSNIYRVLLNGGTMSTYAGMYNIHTHDKSQRILQTILGNCGFTNIRLSKVFIPSYLGEACFLFADKPASESP